MTFDGKCRQKSGNISGFGEICGVKTVFVMCRYGMLRLLGRNSWRFLSLSVSEGVTEFVGLSVSVCHCRSKYLSWVTVSFVTVHHTTRQSPSNRMSLVIAPPVTLSQYLLVTSSTTHTTRYSLSLLRQLLYVRHT